MDLSPASSRPLHASGGSFPIIIIAIIGILASALLLVSYYIFVIKCCLSWHRIDLLRRLNDPPTADLARGLDESVIRSIPIFRFKKGCDGECECAVCLNEFEEDEKLRMIPNCSHIFHIDCIDVWLQSNPNCPLCRATICMAPMCPSVGDEDTNVERVHLTKRGRSMGDECIDMRGNAKDDEFQIQPIRRSISMDSWADRPVYLAVLEEIRRRQGSEEEGSSSRVRRSLFSFGHGSCRGSRSSAALPV